MHFGSLISCALSIQKLCMDRTSVCVLISCALFRTLASQSLRSALGRVMRSSSTRNTRMDRYAQQSPLTEPKELILLLPQSCCCRCSTSSRSCSVCSLCSFAGSGGVYIDTSHTGTSLTNCFPLVCVVCRSIRRQSTAAALSSTARNTLQTSCVINSDTS